MSISNLPQACRLIFMIICLALLTGCKTSGERLELSTRAKLKTGMPRAEVLKLFGKPYKSFRGEGNASLDMFRSFHEDPRYRPPEAGYSGPTSLRGLTVRYSADGLVDKFLYTEGNMIWNARSYGSVPGGTMVHELDTRRIKKGITTVAELEAWFAEPSGLSFDLEGDNKYHWIFVTSGYLTGLQGNELIVTTGKDGVVKDFLVLEDWKW